MKTRKLFPALLAWMMLGFAAPMLAQDDMSADSTGLPGDNFSLEAAIELFKKSDSPEEFEKKLNAPENDVNNLDLNEDGEIDYIRVVDNMDGDAHALVLQAVVNEKESQDVAVIEIEKQGNENAILQIVGDEDLYGAQKIAEPFEEEKAKTGREKGPAADAAPVRIVVNVWFWPSVRFMYAPAYHVWVSPWRWHYYPSYWRPWRPHPWHVFHVRVAPYRVHYHVVTTHRVVRAHAVYAPRRTHSTVVHSRTTVVRGKHGGVGVQKTTTTTTRNGRGKKTETHSTTVKRGPNGNGSVKHSSTTVKRGRRG